MVRDIVPGKAAEPVDGGQGGAGEGSGHVGGGPGGVEAPVADGARVPGEAGVIRASGNLEGLEDGGEDDNTEGDDTEGDDTEGDDTAEGVVTQAVVAREAPGSGGASKVGVVVAAEAVAAEDVVTEGLEDKPIMSLMTDVSWVSRLSPIYNSK